VNGYGSCLPDPACPARVSFTGCVLPLVPFPRRRLSRPQSTIHQSDSLIPFSLPLWSIAKTCCKLYFRINSSFSLYSRMCVNSRKRKVLRYIQLDLLCRDIRVSQVLARFSTYMPGPLTPADPRESCRLRFLCVGFQSVDNVAIRFN